MYIDDEMKEWIINKLNGKQRTPVQVWREISKRIMAYKKDDKVKLNNGVFDDFHHIEAGTIGTVAYDECDNEVMVQFETAPRASGLVLVATHNISPA